MTLGSVRVVRATVRPLMVLAALALLGTTAAPSPAVAQVKAPAKSKLKPSAKPAPQADPTDNVAAQLNAKWQQENGGFSGFTTATPAVVPASFATPAVANDWGDRLVSRAMKYLGTPYRYGGNSPAGGFDCSGLVQFVFRDSAGVRLPRSTRDLVAIDAPAVARDSLQPGDLVFFSPGGGGASHIGIYVGEGRFVHAPSSGGTVRLDLLDSDYWRRAYVGARRLL